MSPFGLTITPSPSQILIPSAAAAATIGAAGDNLPTTTKPSLNSNIHRRSVTCTHGWRITTCVPHTLMAHDKKSQRYNNLGFRRHNNKRLSISSQNSAEDQGVGVGGFSSQDTRIENMEDNCYENGHFRSPMSHNQYQSSKLLTLPTILTLGRVAAVPIFVCTFYIDSWCGTTSTTIIFIAAAITDWLDGYIARKMRLGSAFGAFLDPVADKLMVAAALILLCTKPLEVAKIGQVPWLLAAPAISIIGREITMSAVREWAASQNSKLSEAVAVNNLGKWKTAAQMTALTILLTTRDSSLVGGTLAASGVVILYISAVLAVWSLAVYMSKIWKVLLK